MRHSAGQGIVVGQPPLLASTDGANVGHLRCLRDRGFEIAAIAENEMKIKSIKARITNC